MTQALDRIFSRAVRERDNWTCQATGVYSPEGQASGRGVGLDCAHIFSRAHVATRWHPLNCITLSRASHRYYTEQPDEWTAFVKYYLGEESYEELRALATQAFNHPYKAWEKKLIHKHYLGEFARLRQERMDGKTGRLTLNPYPGSSA